MVISLGIIGISGRMGESLTKIILEDSSLELIGGVRNGNKQDLEESIFALAQKCDVLIDFSSPDSLKNILQAADKTSKPLVIGTTGYTKNQLSEMKRQSKKSPILFSPNFSIGIALCKQLLKDLDNYAPPTFNTEIEETHHINKKDKPSGTAILLKNVFKNGNDIPITSYRKNNVIGQHKVILSSPEEEIELKHTAKTRDIFAKGAILCAKYIYKKPPGLYSIENAIL